MEIVLRNPKLRGKANSPLNNNNNDDDDDDNDDDTNLKD